MCGQKEWLWRGEMRLNNYKLKDHNKLTDQGPHDHHPQGTSWSIAINLQAVPAFSSHDFRIPLGRTGYKACKGILHGGQKVSAQGYTGCSFLAADSVGESIGYSSAYMGSYSYMGCFSRLHGDSYMSPSSVFGYGIRLKDVFIDGSDQVIRVTNTTSITRYAKMYGNGLTK